MKIKFTLTAALLFAGIGAAQDPASSPARAQVSEQDSDATTTDSVSQPASVFQPVWLGWASPFDPQSKPQTSQKPVQNASRPRTEGSMVGYIDNPIVQSQIRIRFDDA